MRKRTTFWLAAIFGISTFVSARAAPAELFEQSPEGRSSIVAGLKHQDPSIRMKSLRLIEPKKDPSFYPDIAPLIHDSDHLVRQTIISFLGEWPGQEARRLLMISLDDSHPGNRRLAVFRLADSEHSSTKWLKTLVATSSDTIKVGAAIMILAQQGKKEVRENAVSLLSSDVELARQDAVEALGFTGTKQDVQRLREIANSLAESRDIRNSAKRSLFQLGYASQNVDAGKRIEFEKALRSPDPAERQEAIDTLLERGDKQSLRILKRVANEPEHSAWKQAGTALNIFANRDSSRGFWRYSWTPFRVSWDLEKDQGPLNLSAPACRRIPDTIGLQLGLLGTGCLKSTHVFGIILSPGRVRTSRVNGLSVTGFGGIYEANGAQISLANGTRRTRGLRLGIVNMDIGDSTAPNYGLSLGLIQANYSNALTSTSPVWNGAMLGLYNQTSHMRGIQVGIYNSARTLQGMQIGLINRVENRKTLPVMIGMNAGF